MRVNLRGSFASLVLLLASACASEVPVTSLSTAQEVDLSADDTVQVFLPNPEDQNEQIIGGIENAFVDLRVSQNVLGDFRPNRIILLPGDSGLSAATAQSEGLLFSAKLPNAVSAKFKDSKHYTVVIAWLKPGKEEDYDKYLDGIEPAMARAGGQFLWKLRIPSMPNGTHDEALKGQITFVEWDDTNGFRNVTKSDEYESHNQYFGSAVEKFEFHWLRTADADL